MILTAHQPVYLPWLGLFHKIALADTFVSFNQVQYLPKDWNNRNKIKTQMGAIWLTVPVLTTGYRERTISEIEINNRLPWQRKHWKSILLNYARAPYFKQYEPALEPFYRQQWQYLTQLNEAMLKTFLDLLGISVTFLNAKQFVFQGKGSELVLDMCRQLDAELYIFGALGKNYADVEAFHRSGIIPIFQDYHHPTYPQQYGNFISHISILDLLFNCGPKSLDVLMQGNTTKKDIVALLNG